MALFPDQPAFARVVSALRPYLNDLVIAGAWAHRLFHLHPLATPPGFPPIMSEDADVATREKLPVREKPISDLLKAAGFKEELEGSGPSPVTSYHLSDEAGGLYVEFIAPLRGSGMTRSGAPDDTAWVAGVTASKLRFVELLFFEPWSVKLTEKDGFPVGDEAIDVGVASPCSYLAQKVLTINRRKREEKRAKDLLYVHDTLNIFGASLFDFRDQAGRVLAELSPTTRREFHRLRRDLFADRDLLVAASEMAAATGRPNPPSANAMATIGRAGLQAIFEDLKER